jgi:F-box-like
MDNRRRYLSHQQDTNTLNDITIYHQPPINRLPDELLIEIFRLCFVDVELFLPPTAVDVPLLLCNVCRRWRDIAVTVPVLWSTIKLNKKHSARFISTWLSRAGTLPIGVSFILEPPKFRPRKSHRHFDILVPLSHRWQYLELRILPGASFRLLRDLSSDVLPSLEVLNVIDEGNFRPEPSPFGNVFQSAPRLHSVDLWGVRRSDPLRMVLPWSQLIRFATDGYISVNGCHKLLDRLPNLRSGYFNIGLGPEMSQIPLKRLRLPDLENLDLRAALNIDDLLVSLTLSALRFLWIDCILIEVWTHTNFMSFIEPYSLNLHTLQLFRPPMSEAGMIQCLLKMPSLVVLVLQDRVGFGFIGDRLLTLLTYSGSAEPPLCTRLETLHLASVFACQDGQIASMVESRWRLEYVSDNDLRCSYIYSHGNAATDVLIHHTHGGLAK